MTKRLILSALLLGCILVAAAGLALIVACGRRDNVTSLHSMREGLKVEL